MFFQNNLINTIQEGFVMQAVCQQNKNRTFKVKHKAGSGAEGQVYYALELGNNNNNNEVVLKFSLKNNVQNQEVDFLKQLMQYQNSQQEITAPSNIIKIIDFFEYNEYFITVMEKGEMDLYKFIQQKQASLTIQEKIKICFDTTCSIHFLHWNQLIHRDIKPENYIKVGEKFKLIDFGLVRKYAKNRQMTIGVSTPLFAAPEIIDNQFNYTQSVDIWALACLYYEVFTGNPFFNSQEHQQIKQKILNPNNFKNEIASKIEKLNCDEEIKQLMVIMLEPDANKRSNSQQAIQTFEKILSKNQPQQQQQQFQFQQQTNWQFQIKNFNPQQPSQKPVELGYQSSPFQKQTKEFINVAPTLNQIAQNQQIPSQLLINQLQQLDPFQNQQLKKFINDQILEVMEQFKKEIKQIQSQQSQEIEQIIIFKQNQDDNLKEIQDNLKLQQKSCQYQYCQLQNILQKYDDNQEAHKNYINQLEEQIKKEQDDLKNATKEIQQNIFHLNEQQEKLKSIQIQQDSQILYLQKKNQNVKNYNEKRELNLQTKQNQFDYALELQKLKKSQLQSEKFFEDSLIDIENFVKDELSKVQNSFKQQLDENQQKLNLQNEKNEENLVEIKQNQENTINELQMRIDLCQEQLNDKFNQITQKAEINSKMENYKSKLNKIKQKKSYLKDAQKTLERQHFEHKGFNEQKIKEINKLIPCVEQYISEEDQERKKQLSKQVEINLENLKNSKNMEQIRVESNISLINFSIFKFKQKDGLDLKQFAETQPFHDFISLFSKQAENEQNEFVQKFQAIINKQKQE